MEPLSTRGESKTRWLVPALGGSVAGSAVQLFQPALFPWFSYAALLVAGVAAYVGLSRRTGMAFWRWSVLALACAMAAFGLTGWRAAGFQLGVLAPALEGRDLVVTGIVSAMPQVSEEGTRFRFKVETARLAQAQESAVLPQYIYLGWYAAAGTMADGEQTEAQDDRSALRAGERWQLTVRLKAPHGNSNPFGFDYELWLWEQGLQATGYVRTGPRDAPNRRLSQTWNRPVELARQNVRDRILERVADRKAAALIAALVVGDQNIIDRADWDIFRATGVAHLMSISGLHVTMFAWLAGAAVAALWRRSTRLCLFAPAPHAALVGGMLLALAYAVFSGWGVPSQRTIWMLATVGLLRLSGRQWPWPVVWLLACAVVVAVDPWALTQAGFWLSFIAVGVLFASDSGKGPEQGGAWGRLRGLLQEQWVITVALTPLSLLLFGQVSLVALLANALAIPWVTLLVTPLAMAGVLVSPLWIAAQWSIAALSAYLQWLAELPFATLSVAQAPLWAGAAGVAGGVLLVLRLPWTLRLSGLPLLLPVLLWQAPRPPDGQFDLLAADIGQGNAVLVRTAHHALLYDAGPRFSRESDAGHRVLVPLLRAFQVRLDTLVLSHRDNDHVGGAAAVLAMQPQAGLLSSIEQQHALQNLRPARRCVAGQSWNWDGVDFSVLHPLQGDYDAGARPNALSCVLRIASRADDNASGPQQVALLVGDIERPQEARLVSDAAPLKADVLLVPHHGSKTSSSAGFLDAVAPRFALVQAGYRNRFGHPARGPMERYAERHIDVFDSAHCGAMRWRSSEPHAVTCQRTEGVRYWHHRLEAED